jgi:drug/metabolite transporter (DMT)-like permease
MTGENTPAVTSRMARLFDVRYVIGGLLGLYGVVLVIVGLTDGPEQYARAAGLAVNLWTGIALLVVAAFFLAWASLRPLGIEVDADADELTAPPS